MDSEYVPVSREFKSRVIGRDGCVLNNIRQRSGAIITSRFKEEEGFTIIGDYQQRETAKRLILEKVEEIEITEWEEVEIPTEYKGLVIGKRGANLSEINKETGAVVTRIRREVHITKGTKQQRDHVKLRIKLKVALARLRGLENNSVTVCCFIDGWNISENCKLKLERVSEEDCLVLPSSQAQFRLQSSRESSQQVCVSDSSYLSKLHDATLETLRKLNAEKDSSNQLEADMWCHFGLAKIRGPSEEDIEKGDWSIDDASAMFQSSEEGNHWRVAFQEGVNFIEDIFRGYYYDNTPKEYLDYAARYDLTFLTPCSRQVRCKVWVARKDVKKNLEGIPVPFSDVKNILKKIHFTDEATRSQSRGWIVLPSRRYLQADILFPGCEFDCRLTIRERTGNATDLDHVPKEDVIRVLADYLSEITLKEDDSFGLKLPEKKIPEGFHLIHKRFSKRIVYKSKPGFSVILSRERSWRFAANDKGSRESTDLHLHCEEWDRLLSSGQWEPEMIVRKLPDFLEFVKEVQGFVVGKIMRNGQERIVPPEILARGPLALQAYYHALDEGKICDRRVPLMLVGQDRSGKTSLKKSLKGLRFNAKEESTVGIDLDPYPFEVTTEMWMTGKKNEEGNVDQEALSFEQNAARLAADTLRTTETVTELSKGNNLGKGDDYDIDGTDDLLEATSSDSSSGFVGTEQTEDLLSTESSFDENRSPVRQVPDPKKMESKDDLPNPTPEQASHFEEIATRIASLLKEKEKRRENEADDVYSILWDFAGQSVYYVTHPLFLTARAIYFLVYNLGLNPNAIAEPPVKPGVYTEPQDSFDQKTNLDYLDFWMSSIASLATYHEGKDMDTGFEALPKRLPLVFLVCTHADKPYEGRDPHKLAVEVYGTLKERPYGAHLYGLYCVDNTKSGCESECQEVGRLRKEVLAVAKKLPHIKEVIPVKWLKYEKTLQRRKKGGDNFISLETAKSIANEECDIRTENEFKTLLNFLHDLRILIHFDDTAELNDLVILDSQWLIDVFKKVITVKPYHPEEEPFLELWKKLENKGILQEQLLEHVWEPQLIGGRENSEKLIALMERFSLLCSWPSPGGKQYLVPSMLKSPPPEGVLNLVSSAQVPSLVIKFESGQVPAGLFPRLVLQFFQWGKEEFWRPVRPKLFHSFSRFYTSQNSGCSVILLCHSSYIEVVYHRCNENDGLVNALRSSFSQKSMDTLYNENDLTCVQVVCRQLNLILECMRNQFRWLNSMKYKMGIFCPIFACCEQRAIDYCEKHQSLNCKQEECLHFWPESELRASKGDACCLESDFACINRFNPEHCAPWFSSQENWVAHYDKLLSLDKGEGARTLSLPGEVVDTLLSPSNDCKEVVRQLEEKFNLDDAALQNPDPDNKVLIRALARKANNADRSDVVEELRKIVPAGTTAPILPESLHVREIPFSQLRKLTITLSGCRTG
ncbi:uncharacterized protein LOC111338099 [Stylophora pistillata]|uniref:uncharacterized protein LOC111338099 n=1 Tax=Stylophora pistillata TaxID=50429 RepID=UPI000C0519F1|nr:uncharacterized protein LOC111338099 [Stylophora pistillata]